MISLSAWCVEFQFVYQHKQKSNSSLKAEWDNSWQEVSLHMHTCWQVSLCLIGMIIFMHNSECNVEPLAWGGVGIVAQHIGLYSSFRMLFWVHMIIKKNFTTQQWVQFSQLLPYSGGVKGRGLDNSYYFPFTLYSPEIIWFQWMIYSTVQVPLRKSFTYSIRNIFSCSCLSWCMQLCLRWWAAVHMWRWERQTWREFCSGYCMLSRESKYGSTVHKSSFFLQKHKNKKSEVEVRADTTWIVLDYVKRILL